MPDPAALPPARRRRMTVATRRARRAAVLLRGGPDAVRAVIESTLPQADDNAMQQIGQHRPINYIEPNTALPLLRSDEGDLSRAVERAWSLLLASNRTPWLFRYAGVPTWVVPDDEGRPVAAALSDERLRHMLARLAVWRRINRQGELVPAHPPIPLVKSLLATPDPGLPVLVGIVNTPVFGRNGTLLTTPGYHPDARLLYSPAPGFEVPTIARRPSAEQVEAAQSLICDDLLGDFPFVSSSEHAHAVALLLLGFLRSMIDGPTPLHLIEKPTPGTGATLMVDAIATILTGAGASVMTEGRDDEEWRKRVTAKLRQVPSIVLIDNLRQKLDSAAVAAALTAPFWEDRSHPVTPAQVVLCLIDLKLTRSSTIRSTRTRCVTSRAMQPCCRRSTDEVASQRLRRRPASDRGGQARRLA
jgi:putative DNA primase/helicase